MVDSSLEIKSEDTVWVTIVTITYNLLERGRETFARQCIESVHEQTYPFVEHIIIDGASNDGTLDLLKEYEQKGYLKVYSEPDKGIYDAMNKGVERARGKYINFLNTDDFFHNRDAVLLSVKALEKDSADYSFADAWLLYENGEKYLWEGDISKLLWASHYCHQTMFVKTDLMRSIGGFDTSYSISADTNMMIRLYAKKKTYVKVPFCIVTYRVGGYSSQYQLQSRIDHSKSFYEYIGKNIGLSQQECFLCWNLKLFEELTTDKQLELICKIPVEYGQKYLLDTYINNCYSDETKPLVNKRYYLFGVIPLLKSEIQGNKRCFWLFNVIKIFKYIDKKQKRKYYLFGFLPIMKIKCY